MSTLPATILNPFSGNLFAPIWAGVTPQLPGYCDVEFDFPPIQVTLGAGQTSYKNPLPVDMDADYLAREIFVAPIAGSATGTSGSINPQDLKIRIVDGDGNFITSDWITANDLCGPIGPAVLPLRKGSIVFVDLWNQGGGNLIVQMGVKGVKRFPCSDQQGPIPPFYPASARYCKEWPGVRFEEYEYFFEFSNGASPFFPPWVNNLQPQSPNATFAQFPLQTDNDADFLWRGVTGMIMSSPGPVAQAPEEFFIGFYDHLTVPMFRNIARAATVPPVAPPGCELVLSNGGGRMNPLYPEILVPRGGTLYADILLQTQLPSAAIESVQFSLRGFKVYNLADCSI